MSRIHTGKAFIYIGAPKETCLGLKIPVAPIEVELEGLEFTFDAQGLPVSIDASQAHPESGSERKLIEGLKDASGTFEGYLY